MKKFNKKGFTLIEMLVVIGIIAALVAIVIPTVTNSTEKAKEAADAASLRSLITEVTMKGVSSGADATATYTLTQTGEWTSIDKIGSIAKASLPTSGTVTVKYTASSGAVTITGSSSNTSTECDAKLADGTTCTGTVTGGTCSNEEKHKK